MSLMMIEAPGPCLASTRLNQCGQAGRTLLNPAHRLFFCAQDWQLGPRCPWVWFHQLSTKRWTDSQNNIGLVHRSSRIPACKRLSSRADSISHSDGWMSAPELRDT